MSLKQYESVLWIQEVKRRPLLRLFWRRSPVTMNAGDDHSSPVVGHCWVEGPFMRDSACLQFPHLCQPPVQSAARFRGLLRRRLWRTRPERPELALLSLLRQGQSRGEICREPLETSATGDVSSGRIAVEYALRGCTSFQIHTLFQLPAEIFAMRRGSKIERAIHRLYFDPVDGFILWATHASRRLGLISSGGGTIRFLDLARARSQLSMSGISTPSRRNWAIRLGVSR